MFGAMFAPRPELVAAELKRVCRPDGRIAMANWTPGGFIGQMFKITASHVAPPPNMPSPVLWGNEETVRERLRDGIADLRLTRRLISFNLAMSPVEVVEFFRAWYGPTQRAFASLDENGQAALRCDLADVLSPQRRRRDLTINLSPEPFHKRSCRLTDRKSVPAIQCRSDE
jgi:SAM-dependent methyltransferase